MNILSRLKNLENLIEHYELQFKIPKTGISRKMDETALNFYRNELAKLKAEMV